MTNLMIGCPVAHRGWILPTWFDHVEEACAVAGVVPTYVFVVDRTDQCFDIIRDRGVKVMTIHAPNMKGDDTRIWQPQRYEHMVSLRNKLLALVRAGQPDAFLSLDSDILITPRLIQWLLEDLDEYDAVGGKCYMTPSGTNFPSWAKLGREGTLQRCDAEGFIRVEVIMAIKMMGPRAYQVDYRNDIQGEDIGWSKACAEKGLRLGWDGRMVNKHIVAPWMIDSVDPRVGF